MSSLKKASDQIRRFEEAAREAGCDETGETFERVFAAVVPPKRPERKPDEKPKAKRKKPSR